MNNWLRCRRVDRIRCEGYPACYCGETVARLRATGGGQPVGGERWLLGALGHTLAVGTLDDTAQSRVPVAAEATIAARDNRGGTVGEYVRMAGSLPVVGSVLTHAVLVASRRAAYRR